MIENIFEDLSADSTEYTTFQVTKPYLSAFLALSANQQRLLVDMVGLLRPSDDIDSLVGCLDYKLFSYDHRQSFHRDKAALVKSGFILVSGKQYYVRLTAVMYVSRTRYDEILKYFSIRHEPLQFGRNSYKAPE